MKAAALTMLLALCSGAALAQATTAACPEPHELRALHLYGTWHGQREGETTPGAVLRLHRHPELSDSVRGELERDGISALLAGDVDDGDLTLEESRDGRRISATWIGRVAEGSCGREFRGTWTDADSDTERSFVLRRASGWH